MLRNRTIGQLKYAIRLAKQDTGMDIDFFGTELCKCLCIKRADGTKEALGCVGSIDEIYAQLIAIIDYNDLKKTTSKTE